MSVFPISPYCSQINQLTNRIVMISTALIKETTVQALTKGGIPKEHAELQLELLLDAELRGVPSHGLMRVPRVIERVANGVTNPNTKGKHTWRGGALLDVDGENGLGPVVALSALEAARRRTVEVGCCLVTIRDCDHLGMLAFYAEKIAREELILIGLTISEALVHPFGGRQAMIGTNPITIGVPAKPRPFVFDMSTSVVSMGKIHDYANRNLPIPNGWALDVDGNPTSDPNAAKLGSIGPFGGAKGYGLGLAFEVLVAALSNSAIGNEVKGTLDSSYRCNKGDVFLVARPASDSQTRISNYLDEIRTSIPADPAQPVRVPGDRSANTRDRSRAEGVRLAPLVWDRIRELAI